MEFLIQQTDSSGKTIYIEKVAKCTPQGGLSMTSDMFEQATCEQQFDVDYMKEGKEKMEACQQFSDGLIIKEYYNLADRAYQGEVCCNSCDNEYTWELSSDILEQHEEIN